MFVCDGNCFECIYDDCILDFDTGLYLDLEVDSSSQIDDILFKEEYGPYIVPDYRTYPFIPSEEIPYNPKWKSQAKWREYYRRRSRDLLEYRKWYYSTHKDKINACRRKYYLEHKDEICARSRKYYLKYKDDINYREKNKAYCRKNYLLNREKRLAYQKEYRLRKKRERGEYLNE